MYNLQAFVDIVPGECPSIIRLTVDVQLPQRVIKAADEGTIMDREAFLALLLSGGNLSLL